MFLALRHRHTDRSQRKRLLPPLIVAIAALALATTSSGNAWARQDPATLRPRPPARLGPTPTVRSNG